MDKTLDEVDQSWLQSKINELLDDRHKEVEYRRECDLVLENDEDLERWIKKIYPFDDMPKPAIVRASTYKNKPMRGQELPGLWHDPWPGDPRRPVIMKGSRKIRYANWTRYQIANELIRRFCRRYKITWKRRRPGNLTEPKWWPCVRHKLFNKFGCPYSSSDHLIPNYLTDREWINGEFVHIEEKIIKSRPIERQKQYVKQLQSARVIVPPVRLPKREELDKWRAAYDALTELGVKI